MENFYVEMALNVKCSGQGSFPKIRTLGTPKGEGIDGGGGRVCGPHHRGRVWPPAQKKIF